ncbi:MAG: hypothetical protein JSS96_08605 [Bacteroidetes bacterium]|nr:hypothetical protein [Bacteroidota bacterium]
MKKVKLFSAFDITALELEVNGWLAEHKDVEIIETNISSFAKSTRQHNPDRYTFYILYNTLNHTLAEVKALIEEEKPSVEATEINPDVLNPTN